MKKILTLTLVATLTMGMFVGCQTDNKEEKDTATNTDVTDASDTESATTEQDKATLERIDELEALGVLEAQIVTLGDVDNSKLEDVTSAEKAGFIKAATADALIKDADKIETVSDFKAIMRANEGDPNRPPYLLSYYADDLIIKSAAAGSLMKTVMVYPIESETSSSALYVETRFNKVYSVTIDEFNGSTADVYDEFLYKLTIYPGVEFYTEPEDFDFVMASMKNLGKSFEDFAAEYDVPNHYATIQGKDQAIETRLFFLNDGKDAEDSNYFFEVIAKDDMIIKVNKIDPRIDLPSIGKYFEL